MFLFEIIYMSFYQFKEINIYYNLLYLKIQYTVF